MARGSTFVLGRKFSSKGFWPEVRQHKVTIIHYVGETCRYLVYAPPQTDPITSKVLDKENSVRIAFGNGMRPDVWNKFKDRFDIPTIAEFYGSTEGPSAFWNLSRNDFTRGAIGKNGGLTRKLLEKSVAVVEVDWSTEAPRRDVQTGFTQRCPAGEPGELLYKVDATNIKKSFQGYFGNRNATDSKIIRDVIVKDDAYFRTGDVVRLDEEGRWYFIDRIGDTFRWKSENVSTSVSPNN
jgi:acyl-CoA synthetase (AMP-forming)/AMP-acid ligase II